MQHVPKKTNIIQHVPTTFARNNCGCWHHWLKMCNVLIKHLVWFINSILSISPWHMLSLFDHTTTSSSLQTIFIPQINVRNVTARSSKYKLFIRYIQSSHGGFKMFKMKIENIKMHFLLFSSLSVGILVWHCITWILGTSLHSTEEARGGCIQ